MKRKFEISLICIVLIIGIFATVRLVMNNNIAKEREGKTIFAKSMCSLYDGNTNMECSFWCDEKDYDKWSQNDIDEVYLVIDNQKNKMKSKEILLDEEVNENKYHLGKICLEGEIQPSHGEAFIEIKRKGKEKLERYSIGEYAFVKDGGENYFDDFEMEAGGIVKTDENGNPFNYGIILSINAYENINIIDIDFGLKDVEISDKYTIYTEEKYKSEIYDLIDKAELDKVEKQAYVKQNINNEKDDATIEIKKGKSYIYLPLEYSKDTKNSLSEAVISIKYTINNGDAVKSASNASLFFMDMNR